MATGFYYIETYGCQMNVHDSEIMSSLLETGGFLPAEVDTQADVIILNTCAIREKSQHKVYSALGRFRQARKINPGLIIVVAGCVAQQEKDKLLKTSDLVDLIIGTHQVAELPELLDRIRMDRKRLARVDFCEKVKSLNLKGPLPKNGQVCSFLTIMQGCSNFCTYCVVPYTRGPEQSRPVEQILDEARWLIDHGVREITLWGRM